MPKKHAFNFKSIQGSSSSSKDGDKKATSVNERLGELRKVEGKDAVQKKKELAEAVSQRSVPPHLRPILGQSESAPPKPKRGVRSRVTNRTPGPAPPKSWERPAWTPVLALQGGRRSFKKSGSTDDNRSRPNEVLRFARMTGLKANDTTQGTSTLFHLSLKIAAERWTLFDDEDLPALAELPLRLRLRLLSYLGFYGPTIDRSILDALTTGSEPVRSLDLSGLAGHGSLTLPRLVKFMKDSTSHVATTSETDTVADSWDQETTFESALISQPLPPRFLQLTHLSLSHPPPKTSWRELLSLSKQIPSVTHLSLAYWSRPTLTPNLATATVSSQYSPDISAGGSNYYSTLDKDLTEPATILRQLSSNLLRLQWLDLEGCTEWFPALAYAGDARIWDFAGGPGIRESWEKTPVITTIFSQNWKNLQYLNCAQGRRPTVEGLRALPWKYLGGNRQRLADDAVQAFGTSSEGLGKFGDEEKKDDVYEVEKRKANIWLEVEWEGWVTGARINDVRRQHACKVITMDHGWERKSPFL